jgi:hypothetical protein
MSDAVLKKFLELKGVIEPPTKKETATKDKKNSEYINQNIKISMINKLIEAKPKEKYIVQYFRERLAELDEVELDD